MSIRRLLADPLPGGAPGLIFDHCLMILGSIFECILDSVYAWCAVFFALFHLHVYNWIQVRLLWDSDFWDNTNECYAACLLCFNKYFQSY